MKVYCFIFLLLVCSMYSCLDPSPQGLCISVSVNDTALPEPQPGDWLDQHPEKGQTFAAFKKYKLLKPGNGKQVIYLLPLGSFTPFQWRVVRNSARFIEAFYQLETRILDSIPISSIPDTARRNVGFGHFQVNASYINQKILKGKIPKDGLVLMAVTSKDLFPSAQWNFVFGLASYTNRVGVTSINRLMYAEDSVNLKQCTERLSKIAAHEIGHMFSLMHCTHAWCIMNGSNSMWETDKQPSRACTECLKKLYFVLKFNQKKRQQELNDFFNDTKSLKDYACGIKDLAIIKQCFKQ